MTKQKQTQKNFPLPVKKKESETGKEKNPIRKQMRNLAPFLNFLLRREIKASFFHRKRKQGEWVDATRLLEIEI